MKRYLIKAGKHYSTGFNFGVITKGKIKFTVKLTQSCTYKWPESDTSDLNKIGGLASFFNQNISARFGWRYLSISQIFEMTSYIHDDALFVPMSEIIFGTVAIDEEFEVEIEVVDDTTYKYTFKGIETLIKVKNTPSRLARKQFPYIGGNNTIDHDVIIYA